MTIVGTTHGKHEASAETHRGKIIGITGDKLVTKSDACGEEWFTVVRDVRVTHEGKPCSVHDLRLGIDVLVTTRKDDEHTAIAIECVKRV